LKVFRRSRTSYAARKNYHRELSAWRQLSHPNILPFMGTSQTNETLSPILVSPWQANGNIRQYLSNYPDADKLQLMTATANAMEFIHSKGIVHGNIHPGNILIGDGGTALVSDIAITKVYTDLNPSTNTLELSHVRYMAPEYICDAVELPTPACDVYSFGNTCFEVLSTIQPFAQCRSGVEVVLSLYAQEFPFNRPAKPILEPPGLDQRLWDFMICCWAIEPNLRPDMEHISNMLKSIKLETMKSRPELQSRL